jgi:GNAT superfamily N-acetyltransferase
MDDEFRIEVREQLDPADAGAIIKALGDFNAGKTGGEAPRYLSITIRDAGQALVGGLLGATYLGWLQVQAVWTSDALRGQGYGTRLMRLAEEEALRRGCPMAFLETYSFQALPFYEKLGYAVVHRIADFPPGGARYALTKALAPQGAAR